MPPLSARFDFRSPNQELVLQEGVGRGYSGNNKDILVGESNVIVTQKWSPFPILEVKFCDFGAFSDNGDTSLINRIELGDLPCKSSSPQMRHRDNDSTTLTVDWIEIGTSNRLKSVDFHTFNFLFVNGERYSDDEYQDSAKVRLIFDYDGWRITLDSVFDSIDLTDGATKEGFALTHVGRLERIDGREFDFAKTEALFTRFKFFLSFARGGWVGIGHKIGIGHNDLPCFWKWSVGNITQGQVLWKWLPEFRGLDLECAYSGFAARFDDSTWSEVLKLALDFYIQANLSNTIETKLVLSDCT
jgi:hypothetical protein